VTLGYQEADGIGDSMMFNEVWPLIDKVDGWLIESQARALFNAASTCKSPGVIVEIGAYKGRSATALGFGSQSNDNTMVFSIDPFKPFTACSGMHIRHDSYDVFCHNMTRLWLNEIVNPIRATSEEAHKDWTRPIRVLFIDGDHRYEMVKKDYEMWVPHVSKGGMVFLHDTDYFEGPKQLVREKLADVAVERYNNMVSFVKE